MDGGWEEVEREEEHREAEPESDQRRYHVIQEPGPWVCLGREVHLACEAHRLTAQLERLHHHLPVCSASAPKEGAPRTELVSLFPDVPDERNAKAAVLLYRNYRKLPRRGAAEYR